MPRQISTGLRDFDKGDMRAISVNLRDGELTAIDEIAFKYGVSRSEVVRYAVRYLIRDVDDGTAQIQAEKNETAISLRFP